MSLIHRKCVAIFSVCFQLLRCSSASCIFNVKDLPNTHQTPILLKPGDPLSFQQPGRDGLVELFVNDKIIISCPGKGNIIEGKDPQQTISTFCDSSGAIRTIGNIIFLECSREVVARLLQTSEQCGNNGNVTIVGHDVPASLTQKNNYVKSYHICFEGDKFIPSYSHHEMGTFVAGVKTGGRPYFRSGGVVPDLSNDYRSASEYLVRYLGTSNYTQNNQLTKGHLTPKGDFHYAAQEDATFFFENVAPQWVSINDANWAKLERSVRHLAFGIWHLQITTGTFGVLKLRDHQQNLREIYLNGNPRVPVPVLFWKAVYDPVAHGGVALFGSNNPFESLVNQNIKPCDVSVCDQLTRWLSFKADNVTKGEIVCCEIKDVKLNISGLPPANLVTHLLR